MNLPRYTGWDLGWHRTCHVHGIRALRQGRESPDITGAHVDHHLAVHLRRAIRLAERGIARLNQNKDTARWPGRQVVGQSGNSDSSAGCLMQSFAETALCTILGGDERAIHLERPLVRTYRESTASKTDTPLFISLALHPAKPSINAGFCSYLMTYEEIGTTSTLHPAKPSINAGFCSYLLTNEEIVRTSNPSCSARRVNTISGTRVLIQATVRIPDCAFSTSSKPERRLFASSVSSRERSE